MDNAQLQRFQRLIASHTGWHIRPRDREVLRRTLEARLKGLNYSQAEEYYQLLESESPAGQREWKHLASRLTNRESYFFRDKGQIALLRERILPELIARNQLQRSLRIWSAGCSTGEEAYTLAILLDELLPDRRTWNLSILGTDINELVVETARRAVYGPWSFRMVEPGIQARYFSEQAGAQELNPAIRGMVRFRPLNLLRDRFPDPAAGLENLDLILCRNVFIYFEPEAVPPVLRKMAQTLRADGYLMTGHAEIHACDLWPLQARMLPGSVIYQRREQPASGPSPRPAAILPLPAAPPSPRALPARPAMPAPPARPVPRAAVPAPLAPRSTASPERSALLLAAEAAFQAGAYPAALASLERLLEAEPRHAAALCLTARVYANLGNHERAAACCRRASEAEPLAVAPYAVLAAIAEEDGDLATAKDCLKKILYLSPASVPAYLDLSALYDREGDFARARKLRRVALDLLDALSADAPVEGYQDRTAGDLARHLRQLTGERQ